MSKSSIDELLEHAEEPTAELNGVEPDDEVDQIPPARGPISRLTMALVAGLLLVAAFGGGVLVQKNHDAGLTAAPAAAGGRPAGGAGGGLPAGLGGGGGGGTATSSGPAVVGTVVSVKGTEITVKDFAGKTHVVHTTGNTTVSVPGALTALKAGSTVSVAGTSDPSGSVDATSVTKR
jgi:ferric-dicitrate binding protein FerR (iron transport regulator)